MEETNTAQALPEEETPVSTEEEQNIETPEEETPVEEEKTEE